MEKVTGIKLICGSTTLVKTKNMQLIANVYPENAVNKSVVWSSSNPSVAIVDSNGLVKGVKPGAVVISAVTEDGGFRSTQVITVM